MNKVWRVAVASTDGKVINEHFGRTREFLIVDIGFDGANEFVEKRAVAPLCDSGEHTREGLSASVGALGDCTAVLVAKIGTAAKRVLEINKIAVYEQPDFIDGAISKLTEYFIRTNYQNYQYSEEK